MIFWNYWHQSTSILPAVISIPTMANRDSGLYYYIDMYIINRVLRSDVNFSIIRLLSHIGSVEVKLSHAVSDWLCDAVYGIMRGNSPCPLECVRRALCQLAVNHILCTFTHQKDASSTVEIKKGKILAH